MRKVSSGSPIAACEADPAAAASAESEQIGQNISAVHKFYSREERKRSASQRHAESIGGLVGRPAFLVITLLFVTIWMGANLALPASDLLAFDAPPFHFLQGMVALAALLATTVVLIKQNRVDRLGEQRSHLDLKVALLIEQKTARMMPLNKAMNRHHTEMNQFM